MDSKVVIGKYTLESLTNGMYTSPLDLYREYIQNAVDSFDTAIENGIDQLSRLYVDIYIDPDNRNITIMDNGCGVKADKVTSILLDIGNSQKNRNFSRGFRGIGRLAGLGYCDRLLFRTSAEDEKVCTNIEFNGKMLRELLLPGNSESVSIDDVIERIVCTKVEAEAPKKRYFEVILENVTTEGGLLNLELVKEYLVQHAPLPYADEFKWQHTIVEKVRLAGYKIPQYKLFLNGEELSKAYRDSFISDRVKKNEDIIQDIKVEKFYRQNHLCAILWYAQSNFYGTILDNAIKGIRIRQGNILLGDKSTCNAFFKEERFNGWLMGELHIVDQELIANSRRDGFEKNTAFYEMTALLKDWALGVSKEIRHISYERSLSNTKREVVEAESVDDVNDLCIEELDFDESLSEGSAFEQSESDEIAEIDYIGKLSMLLNQKKHQTKYTALNINDRLTGEQRKVLERVFDLITQEYDRNQAEAFINTIAHKF